MYLLLNNSRIKLDLVSFGSERFLYPQAKKEEKWRGKRQTLSSPCPMSCALR